MTEQAKELLPSIKVLEHKEEIENCLRVFEKTFGTIIWQDSSHPHASTAWYLKGRLAGIDYTMHILD